MSIGMASICVCKYLGTLYSFSHRGGCTNVFHHQQLTEDWENISYFWTWTDPRGFSM